MEEVKIEDSRAWQPTPEEWEQIKAEEERKRKETRRLTFDILEER